MKPRLLAELAGTVPRVTHFGPVAGSAAVATAFVLTSPSANAAGSRARVGFAIVAASLAFVVDDDAATTLAASPVTRLTQRAVRAGAALVALAAWVALLALAADGLTGVGRPSNAGFVEVAAVALIALAGASLASGRTDDGRGGIAGTIVALSCFAAIYIPVKWWLPLTAEPRLGRLVAVSALALAVALAASADPARRRGRTG